MGAHYSHAPVGIGVSSKKMVSTLWNFANACYVRPGVKEICLQAQDDYAADVNMLLAAGWLATRGCCWQLDDIRALTDLCEDWRTRCLMPLRAVRRYLKHKTDADEMYARIKALELDAERYQIQLMESALDTTHWIPTDPNIALEHNVRTYFETLLNIDKIGAALPPKFCELIQPAIVE